MATKHLATAALVAGLAVPAAPGVARADAAEAIGAGIVICAIAGCFNRRQPAPAPARRAPPAANETVRTDQSALNYFGFPAGTPDGRMGGRTRSAIAGYQSYMGWAATGQLNDWERQQLHSAYYRSQSGGGAAFPEVLAAEGPRGLLKAYAYADRGERYYPYGQQPPAGHASTMGGGGTMVSAPQMPQAMAPAPMPQPAMPQAQMPPAPVAAPAPAPASAAPGLPLIGGAQTGTTAVSMAADCRSTDLLTQANGGPMAPGAVTDAGQALNEQFCAARGHAIARGQQLAAAMPGVTETQIAEQCRQVAAALAPLVGGLAAKTPAQVTAEAQAYVGGFGADPAQLVSTGEICLGQGYQSDDPATATAGAMMLVGAGAGPYGEIFGHHLRRGYGVPVDAARAGEWYGAGLAALDGGAAPAFLPAQSAQRVAVIRAATAGGAAAAPGAGAAAGGGLLPTRPPVENGKKARASVRAPPGG